VSLDTKLLVPFVPNGFGPVLAAAVPAFFSFAGFVVVLEIGGEVKNPSRTMPVALAISFAMVLIVYVAVSLSVVGVIPWRELEGVGAPVGEAAARILPGWITGGINFAVLAAAASSINVLLLGYSRDILALARVSLLPGFLASVSRKHGEPVNAVLLVAALSLIAVAGGGTIAQAATLAVIGMLALQAALGLVALRIPGRMPDEYASAGFRMAPGALRFFSVGLIVLSLVFLVLAAWDDPKIVLIAAVYMTAGVVYYLLRTAALRRRGIDLQRLITDYDEHT
jgi:APA family basic amino acid/polyamine antiporter